MRIVLIALVAACLGACGFVGFPGVYKIDVEQGNILSQEVVDQLKPGMSRRQVRFILGTPLVEDTFNQNRWDYAYVKRNGLEVLSESHLAVHFERDALVEVSGDFTPADWPAAKASPGTSPGPTAEAAADTTAPPDRPTS